MYGMAPPQSVFPQPCTLIFLGSSDLFFTGIALRCPSLDFCGFPFSPSQCRRPSFSPPHRVFFMLCRDMSSVAVYDVDRPRIGLVRPPEDFFSLDLTSFYSPMVSSISMSPGPTRTSEHPPYSYVHVSGTRRAVLGLRGPRVCLRTRFPLASPPASVQAGGEVSTFQESLTVEASAQWEACAAFPVLDLFLSFFSGPSWPPWFFLICLILSLSHLLG